MLYLTPIKIHNLESGEIGVFYCGDIIYKHRQESCITAFLKQKFPK